MREQHGMQVPDPISSDTRSCFLCCFDLKCNTPHASYVVLIGTVSVFVV